MKKILLLLLALTLAGCTALADEMMQPIRPTVTATATETPTTAPSATEAATPTPASTPKPPACMVETGRNGDGWLNIREHPTEKSRILATVPDGTELTIIIPGAWLKVRWGDLTGYVNAGYCTEIDP